MTCSICDLSISPESLTIDHTYLSLHNTSRQPVPKGQIYSKLQRLHHKREERILLHLQVGVLARTGYHCETHSQTSTQSLAYYEFCSLKSSCINTNMANPLYDHALDLFDLKLKNLFSAFFLLMLLNHGYFSSHFSCYIQMKHMLTYAY